MKNKVTLVLIELAVMLTVFALAAALCLNAFVWSDEISKNCEAQERALLHAQNAAEILKTCKGDLIKASELLGGSSDGKSWYICYNEGWEQTETVSIYKLTAELLPQESNYLGSAQISVWDNEACLIELNAAWQEVAADEH